MHQIYKINEMNRTEAELVEKTLDQIRKEKGAAYGAVSYTHLTLPTT